MSKFCLNLFILLLSIYFVDSAEKSLGPVTCGSAIKLVHKGSGHHLHSHAIAWGSGSGQQSITSTSSQGDSGSLWLVKEASNAEAICEPGTPVNCGDIVRLEHASTGKNLHSHLYRAPLSGNQEVSGFGEQGVGDTGDNWKIICESNAKGSWQRGGFIYLAHVDTGKHLSTAESFKFTQQNCGGGCPIMGQNEVSASAKRDANSRWTTGQGLYITPKNSHDDNDEL